MRHPTLPLLLALSLALSACSQGSTATDAGSDGPAVADGDNPTADRAADADQPARKLRISPRNPHFLEYQGEPFLPFCFELPLGDHAHARRLVGLGLSFSLYGSSRRYCGVTWYDPDTLPYAGGQIANGFNQSYWDQMAATMQAAHDAGDVVMLGLWATTRLEYGRPNEVPEGCNYDDPSDPDYWAPDRFEASIWSALRGGPIPEDGDPKDNFYTLWDMNSFVYGHETFDEEWPWQKKNQYYQEQLVAHVLELFAGYPHWMLQPMYEADDWGGTTRDKAAQWHVHMSDFAASLDPDRLFVHCGRLDALETSLFGVTGVFDALSSEGATVSHDFPRRVYEATWSWDVPVFYKGFDPLDRDGVRMDNQDEIPDDYENDIGYDHNLDVIRQFVVWGIGPSAFFHYRTWDHQGQLDAYALELAAFLDTVETWDDEPGDEIREQTVPQP